MSVTTIQGHEFDLGAAKFAEGHTCSANEANALNQVRLENIRNNTAARIKKAAADQKIEPSAVNLDTTMVTEGEESISLRESIQRYADNYEFGARAVARAEPIDPVDREAERIAKEAIRAALSAKKVKVKDLPEGKFEEAVEAYAARPEVRKEAERRVKQRANIGAGELDLGELGLAGEPTAEGSEG